MQSQLITDMRELSADDLDAYLTAHSGLPGPRSNLELADAFAVVADRGTALRLAADADLRYRGGRPTGL